MVKKIIKLSRVIPTLLLCSCSGVGGSVSTDNTAIPNSAPLMIENSTMVPVMENTSTSSVIYIHNNTDHVINNIKYSAISNQIDKLNSIKIHDGSCASLEAYQSCALHFTTPVLSSKEAKGSAVITANYILQNESMVISNILRYATPSQLYKDGVFFSEPSVEGRGIVTAYIYASGNGKSYNINKINSKNSNAKIQSLLQSNSIVSGQVIPLELDLRHVKAQEKINFEVETRLNGSNSFQVTQLNVTPIVGNQAILSLGYAPVVDTASVLTGSVYVYNSGNSSATIDLASIAYPADVTASSGTGSCAGSLAANAYCLLYYNLSGGGSGSITVPYTSEANISTADQQITWYNSKQTSLLQIAIESGAISHFLGNSSIAKVTITNIGGYALNDITPSAATLSGGALSTVSNLQCDSSESGAGVGKQCTFDLVAESLIATTGQSKVQISANYTNGSASSSYARNAVYDYYILEPFATIVGASGAIYTSTTNSSGNFALATTGKALNFIKFVFAFYFVGGDSGVFAVSNVGASSWSFINAGIESSLYDATGLSSKSLYAIGDHVGVYVQNINSSTAANTYTAVSVNNKYYGVSNYNGDTLIAVGDNGLISTNTSANLSVNNSWTNVSSGTSENLYATTYYLSLFFATGANASLRCSTTSNISIQTWTDCNTNNIIEKPAQTIRAITGGTFYGTNNIFLVGDNGYLRWGSSCTAIANSNPSFTCASLSTIDLGTTVTLRSVSFNNSPALITVTGDNGFVATSSDGVNWVNKSYDNAQVNINASYTTYVNESGSYVGQSIIAGSGSLIASWIKDQIAKNIHRDLALLEFPFLGLK